MRNLVETEGFHVAEASDMHFIFRSQHIFSSYKKQSDITAEEAKMRFLEVISTWPTFGCSFFEAKVTALAQVVPDTTPGCLVSFIIFSSTANVRGQLPGRHLGGDQQTRRGLHGPADKGRPGQQRVECVCTIPDPTVWMVQEELDVYPFSRIADYRSTGEHFQMTLETVVKGSNFVCETAHVREHSHQGGGGGGGGVMRKISQYYCYFLPFQAEIMEDLLRSYISMYERQRLPRGTTFSEDYYDEFF